MSKKFGKSQDVGKSNLKMICQMVTNAWASMIICIKQLHVDYEELKQSAEDKRFIRYNLHMRSPSSVHTS